jgi:predicted ferric reductase
MFITRKRTSELESFLLSHGVKLTLLALYVVWNLILLVYTAVAEQSRHKDFQKYTTSIARGAGAVIQLNIAAVLLVASRSFISFLRDTPLALILPLDEMMPGFHSVLGIIIFVSSALHTTAHLPVYIIKHPWSKGVHGFTSLFITGVLLCILLVLVCAAAAAPVRRNNFEMFRGCHVWGSLLIYSLLVIHGTHHGIPSSWKWIIGPCVIYCFDYASRFHREKRSYLLINKHSASIHGQYVLQLRLPRIFHFQAGQYAELKVPSISKFQWHPFTIASAPHESEMLFYVKAAGDWTTELLQRFESSSLTDDIAIHIRGPYGAPAQHVDQFEHLILIGGGVGATPFCSVFKSLENWITNWTPTGDLLHKDLPAVASSRMDPAADEPIPNESNANAEPAAENVRPKSQHSPESSIYTAPLKIPPRANGERRGPLGSHKVAFAPGQLPTAKLDEKEEPSVDSSNWLGTSRKREDKKHRTLEPRPGLQDVRWDQLSKGSVRPSISYWTALNSIHDDQHRAKTYHESLNLMLSMSYGSSSLAQTILVKRARRNATARLDAVSSTFEQDLSTFHDAIFIFLMYSKSVTFNLSLLWLLIARAVLAGVSTIFGEFVALKDGLAIYKSVGLEIADLILALLIAIGVGIPAAVEWYEVGLGHMSGMDLFTLVPATLFSVFSNSLAIAGVGKDVHLFGIFHIFFVWPVTAALFFLRLVRTIGERIALGENLRKTLCRTQSVDFFWTTPTHADDHWLVGEVLPCAKTPSLKLHRYITRSEPKTDEWSEYESASFQTHYGRPGWDDILNSFAEKSKNGTVIGVFVCGQKSMASEIESASQNAMRNSIIRGLQNGTHPMRSLEEVFGDTISANLYTGDEMEARRTRAHGCNIKIVFHKERFS